MRGQAVRRFAFVLSLVVLASLLAAPAAFGAVTRVEENAGGVVYSGVWNPFANVNYSGGSYTWINSPGTATFTFTGERVDWIGRLNSLFGYAEVQVDSGAWQQVNLYAAANTWSTPVWNSGTLEPGSHTVVIRWTGLHPLGVQPVYSGGLPPHNPAALVGIDAFDVYSDLTAPVITVGGVTDGQSGSSPVTATFSATDAVDGPVTATATLNGDSYTSGTAVTAPGSYTLVVTSTDSSGNTATTTVTFTITAPPVVSTSSSAWWSLVLIAGFGIAALPLVRRSRVTV